MKTENKNIENLQEAIEAGLKINAVYAPNGEVVKCLDNENLTEVEFQDGTIERVDVNDLIDFTWK